MYCQKKYFYPSELFLVHIISYIAELNNQTYHHTHCMNRIILVFAFLSLFLASCTSQPNGTLIHNVKGYTLLDDSLHTFEAIAFEGDEILATGSTDELTDQYGSFEQIDGEGNTLLPGLIDAHVHVMGLGFQ